MSEIVKNPIIEWRLVNGKECLFFIFKGTLSQLQANSAIDEWGKIFESLAGKKVILVWQCLEMRGYQPLARTLWQDTIKKYKNQIDSIWLITDYSFIKAGAKIISFFTRYRIKVISSESQLLF